MNSILDNALALYVHVPFCMRRCHYCSFISYAGMLDSIPRYTAAVEQELKLRSRSQPVHSLYFGGGTPSLLAPEQLERIIQTVARYYIQDPQAEVTLEVNPGSIETGYFQRVREKGINRLSLGLQSLEDSELKKLGRTHNAEQALSAVLNASSAGFTNLSVDLMYGLPDRRAGTWQRNLEVVVNLPIMHVSLYPLTLDENTAMGHAIAAGSLSMPAEEIVAGEYELAGDLLEKAGFKQYEISNWARPGHAGRHNLAYWKRTPYLGFGVAAHSFELEKRTANEADVGSYLNAIESGVLPPRTTENIDEPTALAETLFLALRMNEGVRCDDVNQRFGVNLLELYSSQITELEDLGLISVGPERMCLSPRGRLLGNEVFLRFLP